MDFRKKPFKLFFFLWVFVFPLSSLAADITPDSSGGFKSYLMTGLGNRNELFGVQLRGRYMVNDWTAELRYENHNLSPDHNATLAVNDVGESQLVGILFGRQISGSSWNFDVVAGLGRMHYGINKQNEPIEFSYGTRKQNYRDLSYRSTLALPVTATIKTANRKSFGMYVSLDAAYTDIGWFSGINLGILFGKVNYKQGIVEELVPDFRKIDARFVDWKERIGDAI